MGYCINQRNCEFFIKKEDFGKVLQAIRDTVNLEDRMSGRTWQEGKTIEKYFSWTETKKIKNAKNIFKAFSSWNWNVDVDEDGNINYIHFLGEKIGDDEVLFEQIAPWVKHGSWIEMIGEDGEVWRWIFENGKMKESIAELVFR